MKQSDIDRGHVYELARNSGRNGITLTGRKVRVDEKRARTQQWRSRQDGVQITYLNDDGTERTRENGEVWTAVVSAREIVTLEQAAEIRRANEEKQNEQTRRYMMARAFQTEVEELIAQVTGIQNATADTYYSSETDSAKLNYITFRNRRNGEPHEQTADTFVAWLRLQIES